jgi:hypothetical protein
MVWRMCRTMSKADDKDGKGSLSAGYLFIASQLASDSDVSGVHAESIAAVQKFSQRLLQVNDETMRKSNPRPVCRYGCSIHVGSVIGTVAVAVG